MKFGDRNGCTYFCTNLICVHILNSVCRSSEKSTSIKYYTTIFDIIWLSLINIKCYRLFLNRLVLCRKLLGKQFCLKHWYFIAYQIWLMLLPIKCFHEICTMSFLLFIQNKFKILNLSSLSGFSYSYKSSSSSSSSSL
jgi:hypothetical protein